MTSAMNDRAINISKYDAVLLVLFIGLIKMGNFIMSKVHL